MSGGKESAFGTKVGEVVRSVGGLLSLRAVLLSGLILSITNFIALLKLDLLNTIMVFPTLMVGIGCMIGMFVMNVKAGENLVTSSKILKPFAVLFNKSSKLLGWGMGLTTAYGIALVLSAGLPWLWLPLSIVSAQAALHLAGKKSNPVFTRFASELGRAYWTSMGVLIWFIFVPFSSMIILTIGGHQTAIPIITLASLFLYAALGIAGLIFSGRIVAMIELWRWKIKYNKFLGEYNGRRDELGSSEIAKIEALVNQIHTFIDQEAYNYAGQSLDAAYRILGSNQSIKKGIQQQKESRNALDQFVKLRKGDELSSNRNIFSLPDEKAFSDQLEGVSIHDIRAGPVSVKDSPFQSKPTLTSNNSLKLKQEQAEKEHRLEKLIIVAHRGGYFEGVKENTVEAISRSIKLGVDAVEFDVQMTKDGEIVAIHDEYINKKRITEMELKEIREIDRDIPTLNEIFKVAKGKVRLHIHIVWTEGKDRAIIERLAGFIRSNGIASDVLIISFYAGDLQSMRKIYPEIKCCLIFQPERLQGALKDSDKMQQLIRETKNIGPDYITLPRQVKVTAEIVNKLRYEGFSVDVNEVDVENLLGLNADIVTANKPGVLLDARNMFRDAQTLISFLAQRDELPSKADILMVFGSEYLEGVFEAVDLKDKVDAIMFVGGIGHSTANLIDKASYYLDVERDVLSNLSESEIMHRVFKQELLKRHKKLGNIQVYLEKESRNCQENVEKARDLVEKEKLVANKVILIQQPPLQRRMGLTFDKHFRANFPKVKAFNHAAFIPDKDLLRDKRYVATLIDEAEKLEIYSRPQFSYISGLNIDGVEPGMLPQDVKKAIYSLKKMFYPGRFVEANGTLVASHLRIGEQARTDINLPIQVETGTYRAGSSFTNFATERYQGVLHLKTGAAVVKIGHRRISLKAGDIISLFTDSDVEFTADSEYIVFRQTDSSSTQVNLKETVNNEIAISYRDKEGNLIATFHRADMHFPSKMAMMTPVSAAIGIGIKIADGKEEAHRHGTEGKSKMEIPLCISGSFKTYLADIEGKDVKGVDVKKDELLVLYPHSAHGFEFNGAKMAIILQDPALAAERSDKIKVNIEQQKKSRSALDQFVKLHKGDELSSNHDIFSLPEEKTFTKVNGKAVANGVRAGPDGRIKTASFKNTPTISSNSLLGKKIKLSLDFMKTIDRPVKATLVMPIYGDADEVGLKATVGQLQELVKASHDNFSWQLICVDDGSPDREFASRVKEMSRSVLLSLRGGTEGADEAISKTVSEIASAAFGSLAMTGGEGEIALAASRLRNDTGETFGAPNDMGDDRIKVLTISSEEKQGRKGGAVHLGFEEALKGDADYIGYIDADSYKSIDNRQLGLLVEPLYKGEVDVAIGSRWCKDGVAENMPFLLAQSSKIYNRLIHLILPRLKDINDTQRGFKLFKREAVSKILPLARDKSLSFDTELLILAGKISEVGIYWYETGNRTFNMFTEGPKMLENVWEQRQRLASNELSNNFSKSKQALRVFFNIHNLNVGEGALILLAEKMSCDPDVYSKDIIVKLANTILARRKNKKRVITLEDAKNLIAEIEWSVVLDEFDELKAEPGVKQPYFALSRNIKAIKNLCARLKTNTEWHKYFDHYSSRALDYLKKSDLDLIYPDDAGLIMASRIVRNIIRNDPSGYSDDSIEILVCSAIFREIKRLIDSEEPDTRFDARVRRILSREGKDREFIGKVIAVVNGIEDSGMHEDLLIKALDGAAELIKPIKLRRIRRVFSAGYETAPFTRMLAISAVIAGLFIIAPYFAIGAGILGVLVSFLQPREQKILTDTQKLKLFLMDLKANKKSDLHLREVLTGAPHKIRIITDRKDANLNWKDKWWRLFLYPVWLSEKEGNVIIINAWNHLMFRNKGMLEHWFLRALYRNYIYTRNNGSGIHANKFFMNAEADYFAFTRSWTLQSIAPAALYITLNTIIAFFMSIKDYIVRNIHGLIGLVRALRGFKEILPQGQASIIKLAGLVRSTNAFNRYRASRDLPVAIVFDPRAYKGDLSNEVWRIAYVDGEHFKGLIPVCANERNSAFTTSLAELSYHGAKNENDFGARIKTLLDETVYIANRMDMKGFLWNNPFDGAAAVILADPNASKKKTIEKFSGSISILKKESIGKQLILKPGFNTNEETMKLVSENCSLGGAGMDIAVTSNPGDKRSWPHIKWQLSAVGIIESLITTVRMLRKYGDKVPKFKLGQDEEISVILYGFRDINYSIFQLLVERYRHLNIKIKGVSDGKGAIYNSNGLDPKILKRLKRKELSIIKYNDEIDNSTPEAEILMGDDILSKEAVFLIPAAGTRAINKWNIDKLKAKVILEAGNLNVDWKIIQALHDKGILFIPGLITNGGGALGSAREFIDLQKSKSFKPNRDDIRQHLLHLIECTSILLNKLTLEKWIELNKNDFTPSDIINLTADLIRKKRNKLLFEPTDETIALAERKAVLIMLEHVAWLMASCDVAHKEVLFGSSDMKRLMEILSDSDDIYERMDAAYILGEKRAEDAVDVLCKAAMDWSSDYRVQKNACQALGKIGSAKGLEALRKVALMRTSSKDREKVLNEARLAIQSMVPDVEAFLKQVKDVKTVEISDELIEKEANEAIKGWYKMIKLSMKRPEPFMLRRYLDGDCGFAACGKTTYAYKLMDKIKELLPGYFKKWKIEGKISMSEVIVDSQDDYLIGKNDRVSQLHVLGIKDVAKHETWIGKWDFKWFFENITGLFEGDAIDKPIFDHSTRKRKKEVEHIEAGNNMIIIVEGIFIYTDPSINHKFSRKVFIDASRETRLKREIQRYIDAGKYFDLALDELIAKAERKSATEDLPIIQNEKKLADLIISTENIKVPEYVNGFVNALKEYKEWEGPENVAPLTAKAEKIQSLFKDASFDGVRGSPIGEKTLVRLYQNTLAEKDTPLFKTLSGLVTLQNQDNWTEVTPEQRSENLDNIILRHGMEKQTHSFIYEAIGASLALNSILNKRFKLYVFDFDDTLARAGHRITRKMLKELLFILKQGGHAAILTGRGMERAGQIAGLRELLVEDIDTQTKIDYRNQIHFLCETGGDVWGFDDKGELVHDKEASIALGEDVKQETDRCMREVAAELGLEAELAGGKGLFIIKRDSEMSLYFKDKKLLHHLDKAKERLQKFLKGFDVIVERSSVAIDVTRVTKEESIEVLRKKLGIQAKDILVGGDGYNDLGMLRVVLEQGGTAIFAGDPEILKVLSEYLENVIVVRGPTGVRKALGYARVNHIKREREAYKKRFKLLRKLEDLIKNKRYTDALRSYREYVDSYPGFLSNGLKGLARKAALRLIKPRIKQTKNPEAKTLLINGYNYLLNGDDFHAEQEFGQLWKCDRTLVSLWNALSVHYFGDVYQVVREAAPDSIGKLSFLKTMEDKKGNPVKVIIQTLEKNDLENAIDLNNETWGDSFRLRMEDGERIFENNKGGHLLARNEGGEIIGVVWCASLYSKDIKRIPPSLKKIMSIKRGSGEKKDNRWLHYAVAIKKDYQEIGLGPKIATALLNATEPLSEGMGRYTYGPMSGYGKYKSQMSAVSYLMRVKLTKDGGGGVEDYLDYKKQGKESFREYLERKGRSPTKILWKDYEDFKAQGGLSLEDYILQERRSLACTAANLHVKNGAKIVRVIKRGREGDINAGEAALITEYRKLVGEERQDFKTLFRTFDSLSSNKNIFARTSAFVFAVAMLIYHGLGRHYKLLDAIIIISVVPTALYMFKICDTAAERFRHFLKSLSASLVGDLKVQDKPLVQRRAQFKQQLSEILGKGFGAKYDHAFITPALTEDTQVYDALFELLGDDFDFELKKPETAGFDKEDNAIVYVKFDSEEKLIAYLHNHLMTILHPRMASIYFRITDRYFKAPYKVDGRLLAFYIVFSQLKNIRQLGYGMADVDSFLGLKKIDRDGRKGIEIRMIDNGPGFEDIRSAFEPELPYAFKRKEGGHGLLVTRYLVTLAGLGDVEITSQGKKVVYRAGEVEAEEHVVNDTGLTEVKISIFQPETIASNANQFMEEFADQHDSVSFTTYNDRPFVSIEKGPEDVIHLLVKKGLHIKDVEKFKGKAFDIQDHRRIRGRFHVLDDGSIAFSPNRLKGIEDTEFITGLVNELLKFKSKKKSLELPDNVKFWTDASELYRYFLKIKIGELERREREIFLQHLGDLPWRPDEGRKLDEGELAALGLEELYGLKMLRFGKGRKGKRYSIIYRVIELPRLIKRPIIEVIDISTGSASDQTSQTVQDLTGGRLALKRATEKNITVIPNGANLRFFSDTYLYVSERNTLSSNALLKWFFSDATRSLAYKYHYRNIGEDLLLLRKGYKGQLNSSYSFNGLLWNKLYSALTSENLKFTPDEWGPRRYLRAIKQDLVELLRHHRIGETNITLNGYLKTLRIRRWVARSFDWFLPITALGMIIAVPSTWLYVASITLAIKASVSIYNRITKRAKFEFSYPWPKTKVVKEKRASESNISKQLKKLGKKSEAFGSYIERQPEALKESFLRSSWPKWIREARSRYSLELEYARNYLQPLYLGTFAIAKLAILPLVFSSFIEFGQSWEYGNLPSLLKVFMWLYVARITYRFLRDALAMPNFKGKDLTEDSKYIDIVSIGLRNLDFQSDVNNILKELKPGPDARTIKFLLYKNNLLPLTAPVNKIAIVQVFESFKKLFSSIPNILAARLLVIDRCEKRYEDTKVTYTFNVTAEVVDNEDIKQLKVLKKKSKQKGYNSNYRIIKKNIFRSFSRKIQKGDMVILVVEGPDEEIVNYAESITEVFRPTQSKNGKARKSLGIFRTRMDDKIGFVLTSEKEALDTATAIRDCLIDLENGDSKDFSRRQIGFKGNPSPIHRRAIRQYERFYFGDAYQSDQEAAPDSIRNPSVSETLASNGSSAQKEKKALFGTKEFEGHKTEDSDSAASNMFLQLKKLRNNISRYALLVFPALAIAQIPEAEQVILRLTPGFTGLCCAIIGFLAVWTKKKIFAWTMMIVGVGLIVIDSNISISMAEWTKICGTGSLISGIGVITHAYRKTPGVFKMFVSLFIGFLFILLGIYLLAPKSIAFVLGNGNLESIGFMGVVEYLKASLKGLAPYENLRFRTGHAPKKILHDAAISSDTLSSNQKAVDAYRDFVRDRARAILDVFNKVAAYFILFIWKWLHGTNDYRVAKEFKKLLVRIYRIMFGPVFSVHNKFEYTDEIMDRLIQTLRGKMREGYRFASIGMPTSSGKTTWAQKIAETYSDEFKVIGLDRYFKAKKFRRIIDGIDDLDSPDAYDWEAIREELMPIIKTGKGFIRGEYDFIKGIPSNKREYIELKKDQMLIIEGIYALHERMDDIYKKAKQGRVYKVCLKASPLLRIVRRVIRDVKERGYSPLETISNWFREDGIRDMEDMHVLDTEKNADIRIDTETPYELYNLSWAFKKLCKKSKEELDKFKKQQFKKQYGIKKDIVSDIIDTLVSLVEEKRRFTKDNDTKTIFDLYNFARKGEIGGLKALAFGLLKKIPITRNSKSNSDIDASKDITLSSNNLLNNKVKEFLHAFSICAAWSIFWGFVLSKLAPFGRNLSRSSMLDPRCSLLLLRVSSIQHRGSNFEIPYNKLSSNASLMLYSESMKFAFSVLAAGLSYIAFRARSLYKELRLYREGEEGLAGAFNRWVRVHSPNEILSYFFRQQKASPDSAILFLILGVPVFWLGSALITGGVAVSALGFIYVASLATVAAIVHEIISLKKTTKGSKDDSQSDKTQHLASNLILKWNPFSQALEDKKYFKRLKEELCMGFSKLIENAIKHGVGPIDISYNVTNSFVEVTVTDYPDIKNRDFDGSNILDPLKYEVDKSGHNKITARLFWHKRSLETQEQDLKISEPDILASNGALGAVQKVEQYRTISASL